MTELEELKAAVRRYVAAVDLADEAAESLSDPKFPWVEYFDAASEREKAYNALCELAEKD